MFYTTYLIDLDGVVYRGNELLSGALEFVNWLTINKKKYLFLTNNSFATGAQILAKLAHMGIRTDSNHLLTAGQAAVQNIARRLPGGVVYVVGERPLVTLVEAQGLSVAAVDGTDADAVLVGLDRSFDYQKIAGAANAVRAGALFVTINRDPVLPVTGGFLPGCGSLAAAIECASGVSPEVVGKPEPMLLLEALRLLDSRPEEAVMVGDGLAIDILAGQRAGTHTLLVLSGSSSLTDVEQSSLKPDHISADLAAVLEVLTRGDGSPDER
jgi:HAD superfamily hydrolase (TIGR01457 family)